MIYYSHLFSTSVLISLNLKKKQVLWVQTIRDCPIRQPFLITLILGLLYEIVFTNYQKLPLEQELQIENLMILIKKLCKFINILSKIGQKRLTSIKWQLFQSSIYADQQYFPQVMKKEKEEWIKWGKQNKRFLVFYHGNTIDLTDFQRIHPGGKKTLDNYQYKDVSDLLFAVFPHKKETTESTLLKHKIGQVTKIHIKEKKEKENTISIQKDDSQIRKVSFRKTVNYSIQKNKKGSQFQQHFHNQIKRRQANIRNTINEGKKRPRDKYNVSIKLLPQDSLQYQSIMNGEYPSRKEPKIEQLDANIEKQETLDQSITFKIPILEVKSINWKQ